MDDEAKAWALGLEIRGNSVSTTNVASIMAFAAEVRRDERERALAAIPTRQRVVPSHMLEAFNEGYKAGILDKNCAIRALSDAPGGPDPTVALAEWRFYRHGKIVPIPEKEARDQFRSWEDRSDDRGMAMLMFEQLWTEIDRLRAALDAATARAKEYGETK